MKLGPDLVHAALGLFGGLSVIPGCLEIGSYTPPKEATTQGVTIHFPSGVIFVIIMSDGMTFCKYLGGNTCQEGLNTQE